LGYRFPSRAPWTSPSPSLNIEVTFAVFSCSLVYAVINSAFKYPSFLFCLFLIFAPRAQHKILILRKYVFLLFCVKLRILAPYHHTSILVRLLPLAVTAGDRLLTACFSASSFFDHHICYTTVSVRSIVYYNVSTKAAPWRPG
jgi:hypothetical protein